MPKTKPEPEPESDDSTYYGDGDDDNVRKPLKSVAMNPVATQYLALSAADSILRIYDTRMIRSVVQQWSPSHLYDASYAIEKMMHGRTAIVIAHRLSTIQKANNIIVLDKGEIKEEGTHQDLINKKGIYSNLHEIQFAEV